MVRNMTGRTLEGAVSNCDRWRVISILYFRSLFGSFLSCEVNDRTQSDDEDWLRGTSWNFLASIHWLGKVLASNVSCCLY